MTAIQRRTAVVLAAAALGTVGMFFGPDGWNGLDIGPLGATVLYAALCTLVIHLARHADGIFPEGTALAERQAWVALVFGVLIAFHFVNFLAALPALGDAADRIVNPASRRFAINLGLLLSGWIVVSGLLRAQNAEAVELDERDLRIEHAAGRVASGLMAAMMVGLVVVLASFPDPLRPMMRPLIVASALIGLLLASAIAQNLYSVLSYRRAT